MPEDNRSFAETQRIDLLKFKQKPPAAPPGQPAPQIPRLHWSRPSRLLDSVVRSRYQELLQSIYDAALITDLTGHIVDANIRAVEFFQYEQADLCRMAVYELIAGADASLMELLGENLKAERFTLIQAYCLRKDGTSFPAEIAVNKLRLDSLRLCFMVRDVTRRAETEQMLRKEHMALHNAGNGIAIADLQARIEYANPAFAALLGVQDVEALAERDLRDFMIDPTAVDALVAHVVQQGQPWMAELRMRRNDGAEMYVQVSAACCRDEDGAPAGIVLSFADVTAHRRTEEALEGAQKELERRGDARAHELTEANRRLSEALAALQAENERLRQEIAALKSALPSSGTLPPVSS